MSDRSWSAIDGAHHIHPFSDPEQLRRDGPRVMTRGEGVFVEDEHGVRYLDALAGLWCMQVGYGRHELAEAARDQLERLPYYNAFFGTTTEPVARLVDQLRELTPDGLDAFFFANSGSEAVDSAVRFVRHHWALEGRPERRVIVGRELGYHGSTAVAASVGGMEKMHAQGVGPLPDFEHVMPPYPFEYGRGEDPDAFGLRAAQALEERIEQVGADRVAAFFAEPVMGAGGVIVPPDSYWPAVQEICRRHDVLLIADEVICGFGRTGSWWGCDTYGIEPDAITMAKGLTSGYLPMSAVALGPRLHESLSRGGVLMHGFTYSAHPVAAAVAVANLRILRDEQIVERVASDTGPYFQKAMAELRAHPLVGEVRGVGLLAGVELVRDRESRSRFEPAGRASDLCRRQALDHGLIVRSVREGVCLSPPLVITHSEIDQIAERLRATLDATDRELRSDQMSSA